MTQEDKDLLLQDLCGRLSYGIKVQYLAGGNDKTYICNVDQVSIKSQCVGIAEIEHTVFTWRTIDRIKPYLRPMSSMTKEELEELLNKEDVDFDGKSELVRRAMMAYSEGNQLKSNSLFSMQYAKAIDWLNAHHFDYRGLIPKGLALEAPEGMYN